MTLGSDRATRGRIAACAGVAVVVVALVGTCAHAGDEHWRDVLRRAGEATVAVPYEGEILWVTEVDGVAHLERASVRNGGAGLSVGAASDLLLRPGPDGGVVEHAGAAVPVPATGPGMEDHLELLTEKYDVVVGAPIAFLDRRCTTLEVRLRDGGELREQLWVDDATGLVLRRETYEDDAAEPVRLATYLSLDLHRGRPLQHGARTRRGDDDVAHGVEAVPADGVRALREAGWHVPESLPGGYTLLGTYAVAAPDGQPLQALYGDGLYMVSVFQQPGRADWDALPPGLERVPELDWPAFEWPGAMPRRIVWEAQGRMWSLVGDAPPGEMAAIAAALPRTEALGLWQRLGRGFGRMWRAMSG